MIKGSGRSIPGFHLRDALDLVYKRHPQLIDKFGGHAMAAGLSLREADFDAFAQAFGLVFAFLDQLLLTLTFIVSGSRRRHTLV